MAVTDTLTLIVGGAVVTGTKATAEEFHQATGTEPYGGGWLYLKNAKVKGQESTGWFACPSTAAQGELHHTTRPSSMAVGKAKNPWSR
jgi:hypothetical protein